MTVDSVACFLQQIKSQFDDSCRLGNQPLYIIDIGCSDGTILSSAYKAIASSTLRGRQLPEYPLTCVALVHKTDDIETIRAPLSTIPHRFATLKDMQARTIAKALDDLGLRGLNQALLISSDPELVTQDTLEQWHDLYGPHGFLTLQIHTPDEELITRYRGSLSAEYQAVLQHTQHAMLPTARDSLLMAASAGLFSTETAHFFFPTDVPLPLISVNHFMAHDYIIRHATLDDLDHLDALEGLCWPQPIRRPIETIRHIIEHFADGQFVIESQQGIDAAVMCQRINDLNAVTDSTFDKVHLLNKANGKLVQLLSLNVRPNIFDVNEGNELLEFILTYASLIPDISEVIGVTRTTHYPGADVISMEAYLQQKTDWGDVLDPVVRMHVQHGASIVEPVANYRPPDKPNAGYGVLVHYDLAHRRPMSKSAVDKTQPVTVLNLETINQTITQAVTAILTTEYQASFNLVTPLMDLGLDSLAFLNLMTQFNDLFDLDLEATFFFQYPTTQDVIDYITRRTLGLFSDYTYQVTWRESKIFEPKTLILDQLWLLFAKDSAQIQPLVDALHDAGQSVLCVTPSTKFKMLTDEHIEINLQDVRDYQKLFNALPQHEKLAGIIHFLGVGLAPAGTLDHQQLARDHEHLTTSIVFLLQALTKQYFTVQSKLFLFSDSVLIDGTESSLQRTVLYDLAKIIRAEYVNLQCRFIAIEPEEPLELQLRHILDELASNSDEPHVAYRQEKRQAPRLSKAVMNEIRLPTFSNEATYLISGAHSPLGLHVAQWYLDHGARHLALVDYQPATFEYEQAIASMRESGAVISSHICNSDDEASLAACIDSINGSEQPLRGLIHLAGIVDNDLLEHLTWERFFPTYQIKVGVTWILHELTKTLTLDHFVLFSSVISEFAPLGKAAQSVGNGFLDALMYYRKAQGLPCLTIDWGPWGRRYVQLRRSVNPLTFELIESLDLSYASRLLDQLLCFPQLRIGVFKPRWEKLLAHVSADNPFFSDLFTQLGFKRSNFMSEYHKMPFGERLAFVKSYLRSKISTLQVCDVDNIDPVVPLAELGIDKILLAHLKESIHNDVKDAVQLPTDFFIQHPTFQSVSEVLHQILEAYVTQADDAKQVKEQDAIAIIGMSCRFPGGANSPEQFWTLLKDGVDAIAEVPASRWDIDAYYDPDKNAPGKMYTRYGGFIDQVDLFDPDFFGISPREAQDMDPQQRISLEVTWEALENAAIAPNSLSHSNTGVFMGVCFNDYQHLIMQSGELDKVDDYYSTGNHFSVIAGRISYILGLNGPAMAIDTACSSSLVAIDNAVKHLQTSECDLAIAGGVNFILIPESTINFCKSNMLAADGRCKTFDAAADGYTRSEGCGVLILKRLSEAKRDGDPIVGIIRATAINQDGASTGLTAPSGQSQEKVIQQALKKSGVEAQDVSYMEAHGTGTSLGDPIEVKSILAAYGNNRSDETPLFLGSAKTNIGHAEAAAGVAGLMKCVLALQHECIPPHLHFKQINPHIRFDQPGISVATKAQPWPRQEKPRFAAVSSFGFSGTNSHAILEEVPVQISEEIHDEEITGPSLLVLSAQTESALVAYQEKLLSFLQTHPDIDLANVAYTLQLGRQHFLYRSFIVCNDVKEACTQLKQALKIYRAKEETALSESKTLFDDLNALATLWAEGAKISWEQLPTNQHCKKVLLPNYAFQRERFWAKTALKSVGLNTQSETTDHPILHEPHWLPNQFLYFLGTLNLATSKEFNDHQVFEHVIFPATGYIELMVKAALQASNKTPLTLSTLEIKAPLLLEQAHSKPISVLVGKNGTVTVASQQLKSNDEKTKWQEHVQATLKPGTEDTPKVDLVAMQSECQKAGDIKASYQHVAELGLQYGPAFQSISELYSHDNNILGKIKTHLSATEQQSYCLDPTVMDASLQLLMFLRQEQNGNTFHSGVFLPIGFSEIKIYQTSFSECWAYLTLKGINDSGLATSDIVLCNEQGQVLVELMDYQAKYVEQPAFMQLLERTASPEGLYYTLHWQDDVNATQTPLQSTQHFLLVGSKTQPQSAELKSQLATQLSAENVVAVNTVEEIDWQQPITDVVIFTEESFTQSSIEQATCHQLLDYIKTVLEQNNVPAPQLWIITQGAQGIGKEVNPMQAPIIGMGRTLMNEHPEMHCRLIDLEPIMEEAQATLSVKDLLHALTHATSENQIAYRQHRRLVLRLTAQAFSEEALPEHYHLAQKQKGVLEKLQITSQDLTPPNDYEIQVNVRATGLNFRDVLNAMDLYPGDPGPLGLECSGVVTAVGAKVTEFQVSDAVMALAFDSFTDHLNVDEKLCSIKPKHISFTQAASIPLVYQTIYYCLAHLAKLKKGDKLLIHAAAGGIGIAAMTYAKYIGAEIYVTASQGKWDFLKAQGIEHLYDSRTLMFSEEIMNDTKGVGIDVVLNALTGEFIEKTVSCLAKDARFIEIGKRDIWTQEKMQEARPDVDYHIVAIDEKMSSEPALIQTLWQELLPLFEQKNLEPLPVTEFILTDAVQAFRYMQSAKHIGKVILSAVTSHEHKPLFKENASYLITAGLSSLGLALAGYLAEQGAKYLVLTKRRDPTEAEQQVLNDIKASGVTLDLQDMDVTQKQEVEKVVQYIETNCPSLKGIFHTAGLVDDGILQQQTWPSFEKVFAPKIKGSFYLHKATSHMSLDYFVLYSSIVSLLGLSGQGNYAAANAFMDALANHRHYHQQAATAFNWGPWGEVGMAVRQHMNVPGIRNLSVKQGLAALSKGLTSTLPQVLVASVNWSHYAKSQAIAPLLLQGLIKESVIKPPMPTTNLKEQLQQAEKDQQLPILEAYLREQVSGVLKLKEGQVIEPDRGFFDMGMDSLIAVELKNKLQQDIGEEYTLMPTLIFNYSSLDKLKEYYIDHVFSFMELANLEKSTPIEATVDKKLVVERVKEEVDMMTSEEMIRYLKEESDNEEK